MALLAAFLFGQLEKWQEIQAKRRAIWERYDSELADWAGANGVRRPVVPEHCEQAYHMYYLMMPSLKVRTELIARLKESGIMAVFHYLPLNKSPFMEKMAKKGRRFLSRGSSTLLGKLQECPVAEDVSDLIVRLPFYTGMSEEDQDRVIYNIKNHV